jgi:tripartite-type tricarboxylate transporter receptor subunit TctC
VTERLNREVNAMLRREDVRESLLRQAFDPKGSSTAEFTAYVREQYDIWGKAIREAGIQPE